MAVWQNIWEFFFPRERILLVTTFDHDHYLRVKNILLSEGIPHRSRIKGGMRGRDSRICLEAGFSMSMNCTSEGKMNAGPQRRSLK